LVFSTAECDVLDLDHPIIRFWWELHFWLLL
jgi:hypothetical protein